MPLRKHTSWRTVRSTCGRSSRGGLWHVLLRWASSLRGCAQTLAGWAKKRAACSRGFLVLSGRGLLGRLLTPHRRMTEMERKLVLSVWPVCALLTAKCVGQPVNDPNWWVPHFVDAREAPCRAECQPVVAPWYCFHRLRLARQLFLGDMVYGGDETQIIGAWLGCDRCRDCCKKNTVPFIHCEKRLSVCDSRIFNFDFEGSISRRDLIRAALEGSARGRLGYEWETQRCFELTASADLPPCTSVRMRGVLTVWRNARVECAARYTWYEDWWPNIDACFGGVMRECNTCDELRTFRLTTTRWASMYEEMESPDCR